MEQMQKTVAPFLVIFGLKCNVLFPQKCMQYNNNTILHIARNFLFSFSHFKSILFRTLAKKNTLIYGI